MGTSTILGGGGAARLQTIDLSWTAAAAAVWGPSLSVSLKPQSNVSRNRFPFILHLP